MIFRDGTKNLCICLKHNYPRTAKEDSNNISFRQYKQKQGCKKTGQIINNIEGTNVLRKYIYIKRNHRHL